MKQISFSRDLTQAAAAAAAAAAATAAAAEERKKKALIGARRPYTSPIFFLSCFFLRTTRS